MATYPPSSPLDPDERVYGHSRSSTLTFVDSTDVGTEHDLHGQGDRDDRDALLETSGPDEDVVIPGEDRATGFVWLLVGAAAISGLLFGYDTAAISGALVNIDQDLGDDLSDRQKVPIARLRWTLPDEIVVEQELITSATTFGALIGGLVAGALSDSIGRRPVIAIANVLFIFGALIQASCHSVSTMTFGRFTVGLGVGEASCIVPLYIGELAPTLIRGRLVTINSVAVTLGQVVAYIIGMVYQHEPGGWRWMLGLGAVPALVQLVALPFLPESPRMLLLRLRKLQAKSVLAKIYPRATEDQVDAKLATMAKSLRHSAVSGNRVNWFVRARMLLRDGANRRALVVGCGLQAMQQLCGFNSLMYYSALVFASLGFSNAVGVGCLIAIVNFLFTLVALRLVDSLGRRKTMLYTIPIVMTSLVLASLLFNHLTKTTGGLLVDGQDYPRATSLLIVFAMIAYVAGYAIGMGNIPWQQGELFRLDVRGLGTSICTATNWTCNLLIASTFLSLMNAITPMGTFLLYAVVCAGSWEFCYFLYPETSGLSLEQVYDIFKDGYGTDTYPGKRWKKTTRPDSQFELEGRINCET